MIKSILPFSLILFFPLCLFAQTGTISGKVFDKQSGEPLIGVNVWLDSTTYGASTDLDGSYLLENIPAGAYILSLSYISYADKKITGVAVKPGETVVLNVIMETSSLNIDEVIIEAKKVKNSEQALLTLQRKADNVQDGISSQEMSKYGSNDAAESMTKVTGATVVEGKYVYVRGLGDRYSNTQLNGQNLTSSDPYRNSSQLDLIPSNMLDNVIVSKTFTPDQPGNFTGGNVNITTKDFPDKLSISFSTSASFNDQSSLNPDFMSHGYGKWDWLGYDDGSRSMNVVLKDTSITRSLTRGFYIKARNNDSLAQIIDKSSKAVNNQMTPHYKTSPLNYGLSFSLGNQKKVFGNQFGYVVGLNYKRSFSHYSEGIYSTWESTDKDAGFLSNKSRFSDAKSVESPQIGGLAGLSYKIGQHNKLKLDIFYNHDADITGRYLTGTYPAVISNSNNVFETRSLHFKERELATAQLSGDHNLPFLKNATVQWKGGYTTSSQDEPDLRFFANDRTGDSLFYISPSEYPLPFHYFRNLHDKQWQGKVDLILPIFQKKYKSDKLQAGVSVSDKQRVFNESIFQWQFKDGESYNGDAEAFFSEENTGIIGYDSLWNRYVFGNYLTNASVPGNNYAGREMVTAAYGMASIHISKDLRVVGGIRAEKINYLIQNGLNLPEPSSLNELDSIAGKINVLDILPSVNLIYSLNTDMNIRASYTNTVARPNMRESAPFPTYEFIGGFIYVGNPELTRTLIRNYDVRWEWFPNYGEVIAISGYYKNFTDPIVKAFNLTASNDEIIYENISHARIFGVETEVRKKLEAISPLMKNFSAGANVSFIHSQVNINPSEYDYISERNPDFDLKRPFEGQSPFIVNGNLSYLNDSARFEGIISYNVFGSRLSETNLAGAADIYERPRHMLDLMLKKSVGKHFTFKLAAKNLLNAEYKKSMMYKNQEYIYQSYKLGRTYSFGITYSIK